MIEANLHCPHCDQPVFKKSSQGNRYKARTTIMVLHKGGGVEFNCTACKRAVILNMQFAPKVELRKAIFTIPKT